MGDTATLERFFDALNRHDIDRILSHFAPDGAFITGFGPAPGEVRHQGHDALRTAFERAFQRMPVVGWFDATHLPWGSKWLSDWVMRGTDAEGKDFAIRGCDFFEFEAGLIKTKDTFLKNMIEKGAG